MKKGVTIIVCTFNGASRLPKTIQHISEQIVSQDIDWEVIVVDNASSDRSSEVALTEWLKYELKTVPIKVLNEKRAGKIYALEQAFACANFKFSIICDDDNWLATNYLETVYTILESNPLIGAVGGQGIAITDIPELPDWFKSYEDGYATGKQGSQTGDVTERGHLWGAGLGTRTDLYKRMYEGFPSLLTGRLGLELTAGEDAEYCQRVMLAGYSLFYDTRLIFHHYMPAARLTKEYRDKLFKGFVDSDKVLSQYYIANNLKNEANKNPMNFLRLLAISPFRILFGTTKEKREKAKNVLAFIWPKQIYPDSLMSKIKQFYLKQVEITIP